MNSTKSRLINTQQGPRKFVHSFDAPSRAAMITGVRRFQLILGQSLCTRDEPPQCQLFFKCGANIAIAHHIFITVAINSEQSFLTTASTTLCFQLSPLAHFVYLEYTALVPQRATFSYSMMSYTIIFTSWWPRIQYYHLFQRGG